MVEAEEQQLIDVVNRTGYIENLLDQIIETYCSPRKDRLAFFWEVVLDSSIMPIGSKAKVAMATAQKLDYKLDQNAIHNVMALRNAFAHHQTTSHPLMVVGKPDAESEVHFQLHIIRNSGQVSRKKRGDAYAEFVESFRAAEASLIELLTRIKDASQGAA